MDAVRKTALVTGASRGIGAALVSAFTGRGFNVVACSRNMEESSEVHASDRVALVDGDIGDPQTGARAVEAALARFDSLDVVVNNAGILLAKPFTAYTAEDLAMLVSTNVAGFFHVTQRA